MCLQTVLALERIRSRDAGTPRAGTGFWSTSLEPFLGLGCRGGPQPAFKLTGLGLRWDWGWFKQNQMWVGLVQELSFGLENQREENLCRQEGKVESQRLTLDV